MSKPAFEKATDSRLIVVPVGRLLLSVNACLEKASARFLADTVFRVPRNWARVLFHEVPMFVGQ